jgi:hypothetical protein
MDVTVSRPRLMRGYVVNETDHQVIVLLPQSSVNSCFQGIVSYVFFKKRRFSGKD